MCQYDEVYKSNEFYWGQLPSEMCGKVLKYFPPINKPKLLDIGCGEGKDSSFFSKCGYEVDAFDISTSGINKLNSLAISNNVSINAFVSDIMEHEPIALYDVVFSSGVLHYIEPSIVKSIMKKYKKCVKINGIVAFNVFVEKPFIAAPPEREEAYLWKSGQLLSFFSDWLTEEYFEIIIDCNSSNVAHKHALNYLYARKIQ